MRYIKLHTYLDFSLQEHQKQLFNFRVLSGIDCSFLCSVVSLTSCPTAAELLHRTENVNYLPRAPDNHTGSSLIRTQDTSWMHTNSQGHFYLRLQNGSCRPRNLENKHWGENGGEEIKALICVLAFFAQVECFYCHSDECTVCLLPTFSIHGMFPGSNTGRLVVYLLSTGYIIHTCRYSPVVYITGLVVVRSDE